MKIEKKMPEHVSPLPKTLPMAFLREELSLYNDLSCFNLLGCRPALSPLLSVSALTHTVTHLPAVLENVKHAADSGLLFLCLQCISFHILVAEAIILFRCLFTLSEKFLPIAHKRTGLYLSHSVTSPTPHTYFTFFMAFTTT